MVCVDRDVLFFDGADLVVGFVFFFLTGKYQFESSLIGIKSTN